MLDSLTTINKGPIYPQSDEVDIIDDAKLGLQMVLCDPCTYKIQVEMVTTTSESSLDSADDKPEAVHSKSAGKEEKVSR